MRNFLRRGVGQQIKKGDARRRTTKVRRGRGERIESRGMERANDTSPEVEMQGVVLPSRRRDHRRIKLQARSRPPLSTTPPLPSHPHSAYIGYSPRHRNRRQTSLALCTIAGTIILDTDGNRALPSREYPMILKRSCKRLTFEKG